LKKHNGADMASAPFVFADLRFVESAREFCALSFNALNTNENRPKVDPRFFESAPRAFPKMLWLCACERI